MQAVLTNEEMRAADAAAAAAGLSGLTLMEAAGWQVANAVRRRYTPRSVAVLCGPGNNGGDGFVTARLLKAWGWPVRLALAGEVDGLKGDAAAMAERWSGPVEPLGPESLRGDPLVIDALFGAGLKRPLSGVVLDVVEAIGARRLVSVAVDMPSGVDGNSGQILGAAAPAELTVTFFRPKPGHLLFPGRGLSGELAVRDIGIPASVLEGIGPSIFVNEPALWREVLPQPKTEGNKYDRGHLLVACGVMTGAARLAALAGRRAGAGLLTLVAPKEACSVLRACEPGNIVAEETEWPHLFADRRCNACVIGPGLGVGERTRDLVSRALTSGKRVVLDADALTSFAGTGEEIWRLGGMPVLTPHDGEYRRLFDHAGSRLARARAAAVESKAVVLLKGPDTVIVAPDGRAAITGNAPPTLATGGSGDVLAGLIGGLLAQGMPAFEAAAAGAWIQGEAARRLGPGLIAEDLTAALPLVWRNLADL